MRLDNEMKRKITDKLVNHYYPEGWEKKAAEDITAYLATGCPELREAVRLADEHPLFIQKDEKHYVFAASELSYRGCVYIELPFSYPAKRRKYFGYDRIRFRLDDPAPEGNRNLLCSYGVKLPEQLMEKARWILGKMEEMLSFRNKLSILLSDIHSDRQLLEALPEAREAILEALSQIEGRKNQDSSDIDDINTMIGGAI